MSKNIFGVLSDGDILNIMALVEKLEKSSFDYMKLDSDGVSITIGKNGAFEASGSIAQPQAVKNQVTEPVKIESDAPTATQDAGEPAIKPIVTEQEGVVLIKSPNYGLFYAQSEPGAPPYVSIGDIIKSGDTVGLLETMKTFTAIMSPAEGEVIAIHVVNGEALELDQPLISIRV